MQQGPKFHDHEKVHRDTERHAALAADDDAITAFDDVVANHSAALAAPEALHWSGVAWYRKGHKDRLLESWKDLAARYPASYWASSVTFLSDT